MDSPALTPRQKRLIPLLLAMPLEQAAREGRTRRQTIYKWMKQTTFKAEVKRLQDEAFVEGLARIKGNITKAVDTIVGLLESEDEQIQLKAASNVIEYGLKFVHAEELENRITSLEERLKETQPWQKH